MIEVLDGPQMASIDRRAIEELGIPGAVLMENAATAVSEEILDLADQTLDHVVIVCGKGNNGGDGYVVARNLAAAGIDVSIVALPGDREGDAGANESVCRELGIPIHQFEEDPESHALLESADLIVDAIFGTGLDRPPEGAARTLIETINDIPVPVVSIDLPSGLDASSSGVSGVAVESELTVTFCRPKIATILDPAAGHCGELVLADISIPDQAVDDEEPSLWLLDEEIVLDAFPERHDDWHKGDSGRIGIFAGSSGRSGAAVLAVRGALRGGGGLVTLVSDEETTRLMHAQSPESMSRSLSSPDAATVAEHLDEVDVAVIGPGLADDQHALLRELLPRIDIPVVVDATALNAIAPVASRLDRTAPTILTPHPGEMARLLDIEVREVQDDRLAAARELASRSGAIVVLKGHQSLISVPDGPLFINPTGNPAMATGGMGDVLAGLIGAAVAQSEETELAVAGAVWLHGFCGDLLAADAGPGITALDLAETLPQALAAAVSLIDAPEVP